MTDAPLYSQRQREAAKQGRLEVYVFDELPEAFRNQVIRIWDRAVSSTNFDVARFLDPLLEEHGLMHVPIPAVRIGKQLMPELSGYQTRYAELIGYFLSVPTPQALDVIEAVFRHAAKGGQISQKYPDAVAELNRRFSDHSLGYQYVDGNIIRRDSEYLHAEAVLPALHLLAEPGFEGPNNEFRLAHKRYREGSTKEAVTEALKALESTLKAIFNKRQWSYGPTDRMGALIKIAFDRGLITPDLQSGFDGLRTLLSSIVPPIRNNNSGHGQGAVLMELPPYLASYAMHVTAASIVFLIGAHKATK
jgi:hypothetical protein